VIEAVDTRARGLRSRREEAIAAASVVRRLDWILLAATGALVAYGLWAIAGITRHDVSGNANYYVVRQGVYASLGLLALVVGFFKFQPSEFGKLLLVLFLAGLLADRAKRIGDSKTVLSAIGFAAGPIFLVFIQPDLGTAMVYAAALAGVLFLAGTRWTHLAILGGATLVGALLVLWILPAAGHPVLKDYQQQRIVGFMHRNDDPRGATYNVTQSINSVGAGGVTGRGVKGATQTNLNFLPEHATDFVFASVAEQRGFVGVSVLLLLYLLVIWRGLKVMAGARDAFSAIAAGGIVVALLFQVFINVGMTIGIAPITGIPLPFVSVGGSAMIANLLAIGVLEAIYVRGNAHRRRV
jgi:rod shape determining protein RodA